MRRLVVIVGLALMVAACGEDTLVIPEGPPAHRLPATTTAAAVAANWSDDALGELCRGWESEFTEVPAPDRKAHVDYLLRAIAAREEWTSMTVDQRRKIESIAQRALDGEC